MIPSGNGLLDNFKKTSPHLYKKLTMSMMQQFLRKVTVNFKKHKVMRQDLNGEELSIGDRILVCYEKDYGWLGYATITGETSLTWRIDFDNPNVYNRQRNFDKNPKRILKV